ncbi:MAG: hypothetical protein HZA16_00270 [Nitrospirae bacterium]|nr:hypothetical protein [Nitrospirota bacterium]
MTLSGRGTTIGEWGKVAQISSLSFKGSGGTGYNYTNSNAYAVALRASIITGQTRTHYIRNIGGLQILHQYGNSDSTLSAENLYGIIVGDVSQAGSDGLGAVTNAGGIQINKQRDILSDEVTPGGRITNLMGIWMNGDGEGADIVFGPNKETSIYSDAGHLYATDLNGNVSIISPHDPETGEWIFYSKNTKTGRVVRVNMEELVKDMEKLTGKKYLLESFVNVKKTSD